MKKGLSLLLAVSLLWLAVPCRVFSARAEDRDLTVLMYICGSDLESEDGLATRDIREILSSGVGDTDRVAVIAATGGSSAWQRYDISARSVQYYRLGGKSPELLRDAGRANMGAEDTLSDFIAFGISAAPAERYILILWDHGGGPVFGLCYDENHHDDSLSLEELRRGLLKGLNGRRLDVIAFDCCLMNCVDLCADLYGIADYAVMSQEMVSGTGLNYDAWLQPIVKNPDLSSAGIADSMAQTYVAENARGRYADTATMSVIALDRMPAVTEAADAFSGALCGLMETNRSGVVRLRARLTSFGEFIDSDASDLVDVEDMCDAFSALLPEESAGLKQAAQQAVCSNYATEDIASCAHGLSFFMPYDTIRSDGSDIVSHYSARGGAYAELAVALAGEPEYAMSASQYTPSSFYSNSGGSGSGALCDIWDGYYGDTCSFDEAYESSGGNIWAGLNTASGSVWEGYASSGGVWSGYPAASATAAPSGGIWAGLEQVQGTAAPAASATEAPAASALNSIWQGLMQAGSDYYQPGEENQNVQQGISDAVTAEDVLSEANQYFSSSALTSQMIYSLQLTRDDLDHLSAAGGVLSRQEGDETIRLGSVGETTVDWSTGLVFSMFDGSWPMLENQMVRAEFLYEDGEGSMRFMIPARVNGVRMYLLGSRGADGQMRVLGATQGYDENGFAIRGTIPLEQGMVIVPLFTATSASGAEREYEGVAVTVPEEGLTLSPGQVPEGEYRYCFALTDLNGEVHYTDSAPVSF